MVATIAAYLLTLAGPEPIPAGAYVFGTLFALVVDLGVLIAAAAVLRLALGTLSETSLKVLFVMQLLTALVAGAQLVGGPAIVFVCAGSLLLWPALFVRLFGWSWGEAILVFLAHVLCHYAVLRYLESLSLG